MTFVRTDALRRDFQALPKEIQVRAEKAFRLFSENPRHPSLQVKKMQPKSLGIFELRVTREYRLTFQFARENVILRRVGTHDILRKG